MKKHGDDDDQLGDTIEQIQALEKKLFSLRMEKLKELDKKFPPDWRMINNTPELTVIAYYLVTRGWTPLIEQEMSNWGAYSPGEGRSLEHPLIQSLLTYGQLVLVQPNPKHYVQEIIASLGYYEDKYRRIIEA